MNEQYGIELKLLTNKFKAQMNNIANSVKIWANKTKQDASVIPDVNTTNSIIRIRELEREITTLKKEMADTEVGSKAFNNYAIAIDNATKELNELQVGLNQVNKTSKNLDLEKNLNKATNSGKKIILSLFSLRSIWSLISRASSSYIQTNDVLNNKIQLTSQIFGNMLAPAIKKVVDYSQYAGIILAKVIQLFTGYNALANITTKSLNGTSKASKNLSKSLASFDTITNLGDKTSGVSSDITSSVNALNDFQEKIQKVEEIFSKYEDEIKLATIALLGMIGAGMIAKIAKFIGSAGTGALASGASGLLGILSIVTLLGAASILIPIAVKGVKDVYNGFKDLRDIYDASEESAKKCSERTIELTDNLREQARAGEFSQEQMKGYNEILANSITSNIDLNKTLDEEKTLWGLLTGGWANATAQQKENNKVILDSTEKLREQYNQGELNNEMLDEYQTGLEASIDILKDNMVYMDKNSQEYSENADKVNALYEELHKLTGQDYSAELVVKADTSSFKSKLRKIFDSTGWKVLTTVLNVVLPGKANIANWINSFDVGTNYVPNDQLAMIHKGEQIIPAKWNPATSGIYNNNDEVVRKLDKLITTLENKKFSASISSNDIGRASTNYINEQSRIMGRSVIR